LQIGFDMIDFKIELSGPDFNIDSKNGAFHEEKVWLSRHNLVVIVASRLFTG
jgi:hypothetical protein